MEIKDKLNKPCSEKQREDFIINNNYIKDYEIVETDEAFEALKRHLMVRTLSLRLTEAILTL